MNIHTIVRKLYQNKLISLQISVCISLVVCCLISSCQSEHSIKGEAVNLFGGTTRTNSYERFGSFVASVADNEKILTPDSSGSMIPPLAVSSYQTVCSTVNGTILQCTSSMVEWSAKLDNSAYVISGMCADGEHNIYAVASDGCMYSFTSNGKRRFKTQISSDELTSYWESLAVTDGIICTATNGQIAKVSFDGKIRWQYKTTLAAVGTASSDEHNNVYISYTHNDITASDSLVKLSKDGKQVWKVGFTARLVTVPVVGNGMIVVGSVRADKPVIMAMDMNGKVVWSQGLKAIPRGLSIANDGSIVTVSYNAGLGIAQSSIEQFSPVGKSEWNINFDARIASPALIGKDNIALIGVKSTAIGVYLINRKGVLDTFLSLDSAPSLILKPVVTPGASIIFAGARNGYITRVGAKRGLLPI